MILTVSVERIPEAILVIRKEMSNLLREFADSETDPRIAKRLREVADVFEVGVRL